jgi:uncharacterized protein with von Willebrand factor type A (vWA) domain
MGADETSGARPEAVPSLSTALLHFVHRLREAAVPVSMVEMLDAAEAVRRVDVTDRSQFRAALRATLVKRAEHLPAFESLFDIYFAVARAPRPEPEAPLEVATSLDRMTGDRNGLELDVEPEEGEASTDLLRMLLDALRSGDPGALRALASLAVNLFGGIERQQGASERYYVYRILRQLELSELLRRAILEARAEAGERSALGDRLVRDELARRVDEFRKLIAQEVRRRLVEVRGVRFTADVFHDRPIEDVDFLDASPTELQQMRQAIRPLAQKLAARIARRRRLRRHGRLDARRTFRRSLSAGGVPLDPAFRYPRASKPDLYLLCDLSGSMAEFARFTMSLLYAMKQEFSRIRLFVFVDGIDEVTDLMEETGHALEPRNLLYRANVISGDGHSDYGNVFARFWQVWGYADLDPRSTVIITGDARNNYRASGVEYLRQVHERARKVYWLNPEPRREWNTTDSIMAVYESACDGVFEARNLRQLADFVYAIT